MRSIVLFAAVMMLVPCLASGLSDAGAEAGAMLGSAEEDMLKMLEDGLSVTRYNDTLFLARQMYEGQLGLEDGVASPDYSMVVEKVGERGYGLKH